MKKNLFPVNATQSKFICSENRLASIHQPWTGIFRKYCRGAILESLIKAAM